MENKKRRRISWLGKRWFAGYVLLMFVFVQAIAQQTMTITGNVKDKLGEPVIGANVVVKGTSTGTITDVDGNFRIPDAPRQATVVVTFIGYHTREVAVKGNTPLNIVLEEDNQTLDEVVVVGYGVQRKSDLTGSVASVSSKTLEQRPQTNLIQSLQGTVPGLNITIRGTDAEGSSSSTRIRGDNSISADNKPLIILDGILSMVPGLKSILMTWLRSRY